MYACLLIGFFNFIITGLTKILIEIYNCAKWIWGVHDYYLVCHLIYVSSCLSWSHRHSCNILYNFVFTFNHCAADKIVAPVAMPLATKTVFSLQQHIVVVFSLSKAHNSTCDLLFFQFAFLL